MMMYILVGAIAIGIGGMIFAATMLFQGDKQDQIEDRLASLTQNGGRGITKQESAPTNLLKTPIDDVPNKIEEFANRFLNLRKFLETTGTEMSVGKFVAISVGLAGVAGALCLVFSPWKSLVPAAAIITGILPLFAMNWIKKRRLNKFGSQLPAALD